MRLSPRFTPRFTLFQRTILWLFLNQLFLVALFWLIPLPSWFSRLPHTQRYDANQRMESVATLLADELKDKTSVERDAILQRYSRAYRVSFSVYDNDTQARLAGATETLPEAAVRELQTPPETRPIFSLTTYHPMRYWAGARILVFNQDRFTRATLFASSDQASGNGLFFDPWGWLLTIGLLNVISILFWLPFAMHNTRFVAQMTRVTEHIADEHFDARVNESRSDELGRLGKAINHLATRLAGFVKGQKRFLGDIAHELNSPLGRLQFALSVIEDNATDEQLPDIAEAREEVELMSKLVSELLIYAQAGLKTSTVELETVQLHALAQQVIAREASGAQVTLALDESLTAHAHPELLARALGNLIRNAVRYAGAAGPITLAGAAQGDHITLSLRDCGAGVPEAALSKLFDPFYRLETDRARATGGTGLGLAIVKTCIETCQGRVFARNRQPHGLEIVITLPAIAIEQVVSSR
ncbi:MAG: HAMP domain-containing histidine kinase [Acidobacteria bacterium]|nr:HAMP domain-containing histidine kinase [Acidobacteriota bacterium]